MTQFEHIQVYKHRNVNRSNTLTEDEIENFVVCKYYIKSNMMTKFTIETPITHFIAYQSI